MDILRRNNIRVYGQGDRWMLMAHGFGCDQNVWRHFIAAFEPAFRIAVFDYVGAGKSDLKAYDPERYNSLDGYAKDVLEVLEALNIPKCVFVGHSVSSMIGVSAALLKPDLFESLIMVAPSPCYINHENYHGGMDREDVETLFQVMDSNYLGWSASMAPMVMGNPDVPELGDELTANFCATDPEIAKAFARVTFLSDNRHDLQNIKVKSLTLQCSEDILAPLEVGKYINTHTPGNTLKILKATGHCPHLSAPEECIAAVKEYLENE